MTADCGYYDHFCRIRFLDLLGLFLTMAGKKMASSDYLVGKNIYV